MCLLGSAQGGSTLDYRHLEQTVTEKSTTSNEPARGVSETKF